MCNWKSTIWRPVWRRTEAQRSNKIFTNTPTFPSSTVESLPPCPRGEMESRKQSLSPSLPCHKEMDWQLAAIPCHKGSNHSQIMWPCLPLSGHSQWQFYSDFKGLIDVESFLFNRVKSNSVSSCIFQSGKCHAKVITTWQNTPGQKKYFSTLSSMHIISMWCTCTYKQQATQVCSQGQSLAQDQALCALWLPKHFNNQNCLTK